MSKSALVIVDVQNDYFPGGAWELNGQVEAAQNVKRLLEDSRSKKTPIIHIQHVVEAGNAPFFNAGTEGVKIHDDVLPQDGEPLVTKQFANSFLETNLKELLDEQGIEHLVVVGSMSHNCIDATVRAAVDLGYTATIIGDACATLDMEHNGETIPAKYVHGAFMASLAFAYGKVVSTDEYLAA
ncbi:MULTISPECIES: cysteine hydrolase family protein [unclassified Pseudovibrio]|uniref:cysteine hydrolase family protein n=1 Tax=unclassified Pseudovibrio TaxID=2627060 RepID=UPI0007AE6677|nr:MULTISPECIES: cysteine hydrolase family protein [unclassified Pseudovibrio]KZK98194.1 Streptothricin hydrolase [Pseudovibrio sp. W74]KZK99677.1 Streptothricin hydrolase [Pseudovibrio sp. Ad5]KZL04148.1 Streptothricin hydrolase [Pseudovibrio sp. Ad14]